VDGEIRCDILTVADVDISTLIASKQSTLVAGDNINIVGNIISSSGGSTNQSDLDLKRDVLISTSNIITGTIVSGSITGRTGTTITAPTITASGTLFYGSNNVATKISSIETSSNRNQATLTSSSNITTGKVSSGNITAPTITATTLLYGTTNVATKIGELKTNLNGTQNYINDNDLSISKTFGLQDAFNSKQ